MVEQDIRLKVPQLWGMKVRVGFLSAIECRSRYNPFKLIPTYYT